MSTEPDLALDSTPTTNTATSSASSTDAIRAEFQQMLDHMGHILPAQAPLNDFVHHNTLHGLQHLDFNQAVKQSKQITGAYGYQSAAIFRQYYQQGRINDADLDTILNADKTLQADKVFIKAEQGTLYQRDIYKVALLHPIKSITSSQLAWQVEENHALSRFQENVSKASQKQLRNASKKRGQLEEDNAIERLWESCLDSLGLKHDSMHSEAIQDLSPEHAESMFIRLFNQDGKTATGQQPVSDQSHYLVYQQARKHLDDLLGKIGDQLTLGSFINKLTGENAADHVSPLIIRYVSSWLDQGVAAWQPQQRELGFYGAWKASAKTDLLGLFDDLPDWNEHIDSLPDDAAETIIAELTRSDIPREKWTQYLERLALELPGWSGMFLWRHQHPNYKGIDTPVDMLDYLAVRLILEHLFVQRICRNTWLTNASVFELRAYFHHHHSELLVRYQVFNEVLPEYLITRIQQLIPRSIGLNEHRREWRQLAQMILTWQQSPEGDRGIGYSVYRSAWRLFLLCQHLGLYSSEVQKLDDAALRTVFKCLDTLEDEEKFGFLWLQAYEIHYRDTFFNAILQNENRGSWKTRDEKALPDAQLVFCMDDREEGIRRHLEELNPQIETLGAAAFFNVIMNWKGLDDQEVTALCPVVATPVHQVTEVPQDDQTQRQKQHQKRRNKRLWWHNMLHQETRRNPVSSLALMALTAPLTLAVLLAKVFTPLGFAQKANALRAQNDLTINTITEFTATETLENASPEHNQHGFNDEEQAERVEAFLRATGLIRGYAALVVLVGHGSSNSNNPHKAAYDCGACSGRHSGANARVFAAMANRPVIREKLAAKGIIIPTKTWFLGAIHNTADESMTWFDSDQIPAALNTEFDTLQKTVYQASLYSAAERCRKFASAPKNPSLEAAQQHVEARTFTIGQSRPELGHTTNAAAVIGRRSVSRGLFLDRRVFLISYDCTTDLEGDLLEKILLSAGPVGAGINLEYYFSTVNNERYGCGTKTVHNIAGRFGVMEGTSSDLRTGLPWQMVDIHEAMRLQILVEAKIEVLTKIYQRQPPLQELIGKGWILVSAKDPDTNEISTFQPDQGFVPWQGEQSKLATVKRSAEWYHNHYHHLSPALVSKGVQDTSNKTLKNTSQEANHA